MSMQTAEDQVVLTQRERELGAIISSYNEVTERLKTSHERLNDEVARLREELRRKNEELRRRERLAALGEMAAGLAHEIRNPLGGIALYASMLEKELADRPVDAGETPMPQGNRAHAAAVKISHGVRSLEQLVSEILDFAQEYRLERHTCKLGGILAAVEDCTRPWAEEHQVTVMFKPSALGVEVYCDPLRLRQVLVNLMMNGIQSTGKGGYVRLSAERHSECRDAGNEEGVQIEVCDDGSGIPSDQLDRIFNPFFTTRSTGTGLGLAIVHRIVEAHGGTINASNCREGGARFVVRLPGEIADRRLTIGD